MRMIPKTFFSSKESYTQHLSIFPQAAQNNPKLMI